MRELTYVEAIREATEQAMEADPSVFVMGLDVDDHKGIQGSTLGLVEKFGEDRVFGTPLSEDAMTGVAIGAAMTGMRPVLVHIRMDFLLLTMNQLINVAAKARYMYGGNTKVPLVVRCMVGKSWGQGSQHSQALHSLFAHIPGLIVVAPQNAYVAKGALIAAIRNDNPVIFMEHRLLYSTKCHVPEEPYFGAEIATSCGWTAENAEITLIPISSMYYEAASAMKMLDFYGVRVTVVSPIYLSPLAIDPIVEAVEKTGRALIIDNGWLSCGISAEISAQLHERLTEYTGPDHGYEEHEGGCMPQIARMGFADTPCPTAPSLEAAFYPNACSVATKAWQMCRPGQPIPDFSSEKLKHEADFQGPF